MADITDPRAMIALSRLLTERNAALRELDAARARIAKLEQEPPMTLVDFGYGLDLQGIRDDLKFLDDVRKQNQELRAEVERLRNHIDSAGTGFNVALGAIRLSLEQADKDRDALRADLRCALRLLGEAWSEGAGDASWSRETFALLAKHKETP